MFTNMKCIHDVIGVVTQVLANQKFVVAFTAFGQSQTGILTGHRLKVVGSYNVPGAGELELIGVGAKVRFSCHEFGTKAAHEYDWYITNAWLLDHLNIPDMFLGLFNCSGKVQHLTSRLGVLNFIDYSGTKHSVLFLASKFFYKGKRLNSKQNLSTLLSEDDIVLFDAVPCIPEENEFECTFFAAYVWMQGPRPHDYDSGSLPDEIKCSPKILQEYKSMTVSPRSLFLRRKGQILKIINSEYGIALMCVQNNRWDTVLFHRSVCYIYQMCLTSQNLEEVFCEGDLLDIIAVPAGRSMVTQWAATQIAVTQC